MAVKFAEAHDAAVARYSLDSWRRLNRSEQSDAIYREMRQMDLEQLVEPSVHVEGDGTAGFALRAGVSPAQRKATDTSAMLSAWTLYGRNLRNEQVFLSNSVQPSLADASTLLDAAE